jgi:drug/metabolite transporter (DMT)-like permease
VALVLAACVAWAYGSLQSRKLRSLDNPWVAVGPQMLVGGAAMVLAGGVMGEAPALQWPSARVVAAFFYLCFIGAMLAWGCYFWLLRNVATEKVATYAFVNPWVAMLVGWFFLDEKIGPRSLLASALIVGAVALLLGQKARKPAF